MLLFLVMNKKNKGFTLTETLLTITILVILFALAVPGVFTIKKNLRQMELDDKAKIIYTAVQNRLSELYTGGLSDVYNPDGKTDYIKRLGKIPGDYDNSVDNNAINENTIYYFTSANIDKLEKLIGDNVIDDSLKNGHFVIEFMPYAKYEADQTPQLTVPFVYAVYYSEDLIDVASEYSSESADYLSNYRLKQIRLEKGAKLGYYGGSTPGSGSTTRTITISSAKIYSEEEVNRAIIKGRIGPGVAKETVTFTFEFRDEHGHKVIYNYAPVTKATSYSTNGGSYSEINKDCYKISNVGNNYTFDFLMDDLSSEDKRFKSIFSSLTPGDDITLTTKTICTEGTVICYDKTTLGNSIFADRKDNGGDKKTAYISNGRHLQNLDSESHVYQEYSKAVLLNDIDFNKDGKFSVAYKDSYINGSISINRISNTGNVNTAMVPCFKGIVNSNLRNFDGKGFTIKELASRSGLFNNVDKDLTITDLNMTGERVYGNSNVVGGLISTIDGANVTITKCGIYFDKTIDIPTNINSKYNLEAVRWIYGQKVSGGLVGLNNGTLKINSSFVATNIGLSKENTITGGLVGQNTGTLNINRAYSDCYLYGSTIGGLVGDGNGTINISNAYSAGFIGTDGSEDAKLAGLVFGNVNEINNSYTVIAKGYLDYTRLINGYPGINLDNNRTDSSLYYATVKNANSYSNLYYLKGEGNNALGEAYNELTANLGSEFKLSDISSYPYKLMGTSLTSYNYHKLIGMKHYGDWTAEFAPGSLVYYEKYKVGNREVYGFDGANVENSLNDKNDIVGDGYGVAFRESDIVSGKTFKVNETNIPFSSDYYQVTKGNVTYRVYPIDITNKDKAIDGFYEKSEISTDSGKKTFYYNPHFGHSAVESDTKPEVPNNVYIRSPRHLNNLAVLYKDYRKTLGSSVTYTQERKMDYAAYEWKSFGTNKEVVDHQVPIGETKDNSFIGTYKGGSFEINNINFRTISGAYIGLFGYNSGTIKDVVVATQYAINGSSYNVTRKEPISSNQEAYFGVLAGYNDGVIDNSAIAGYYLAGQYGKIYGYRNSYVYIGGLVGYNSVNGSITNSAADLPKLSIDMNTATAYAGAFVGYNEGIIDNTYGISLIESKAPDGDTKIAGFAGYNTGTINNSYCATSLISSGNGSKTYNFAPNFGGGTVNNSFYLHGGSFNYIDNLYSFDGSNETSGTNKIYEELVTRNAVTSKYHDLTTSLDANEVDYPYRTIVKDSNDKLIHYGEWQVKPKLGVVGVFYWEHEEDGANNGYKITYIGSSYGNLAYSSNLCTQHDDGGVITEYGYGFYYGKGVDVDNETQTFTNLTYSDGKYNKTVKTQLERQMPHIQFFPFTTTTDKNDSYIYLEGKEPNGNIELTLDDKTYNFTISPFFANSISFNTTLTTSDHDAQQFINRKPGLDNNPYEVRSADQLQYINWNYEVSSSKELVEKSNYQNFNYLMFTTISNGTGNQSSSGAGNSVAKNYVFKQSHDLNAKAISNFVPISGQNTSSNGRDYNAILYTWFGGTYDGQSYKIQELNINSKSFTVGLFGVTVGANLKNTILYSTQKAIITRSTENTDGAGAYALGGLVGIAYGYNNETNEKIENCAIAGYKIIDDSKNQQTLGEANVGGLIGVSNVNVDRCSAVVDIEINCKHEGTNGRFTKAIWGNFIRVGGISGAVQDEISNSYSGGSIKVSEDTLKETYSYENAIYSDFVSFESNIRASKDNSTHIFLSGIAGSGFTMNYQNFTGNASIKDGNPKTKNCYTYMDFPALEGTIRSITMMTSAADRYGQYSVKVDIRKCYYLERSGKIDMSKAPVYYFAGDRTYSNMRNWTDDIIKDMVLGSSLPISKYFSGYNNSSGMNNGDNTLSINNVSKNYKELSSTDMNKLLGPSFGDVSIKDDSNVTVNGKYSFSAGDKSLTGKDYPFPTVIRQSEGNDRTVNVHYGTWPLESAYFEEGSGTIDIFNNMEDTDGFAYKEFVLMTSGLNITDLEFNVEDGNYAELVKYEDGKYYSKDSNNNFKIKLKAKKVGATDVTASWKVNGVSYSAKFNLVVTANLNLTVNPESTIYMNSGESVTFGLGKPLDTSITKYLQVTNTDVNTTKDYSNKVVWDITSSKIGTGDDNAFEIDKKTETFKVTSNGFNGIVTATVTYTYNGNKYSTSANINILTNYTVGICGNNYSELTIKDTGFATMATSPTYGSFGPKNDESKYFIYERNDSNATIYNNLIKNVELKDISLSSNNPDIQKEIDNNLVDIKLSDVTTNSISNNDYNTRAITLSYRGTEQKTLDCTLTVKIKINNETTIPLVVPVTVTTVPYKLTLDADGGTIENHTTKVIELTTGEEIDLSKYTPDPRIGYDFDVWLDENDNPVTSITPTAKDVYLKARYVAKESKISFNSALNGDDPDYEDITRKYNDFSDVALTHTTKEGYILEGWYDKDGVKVVDAKGKIQDTELFNQYLLVHINDESQTYVLRANWIKAVKLTLKATNINGNVVSTAKDYEEGTTLTHVDIPTYNLKEGYTFDGFVKDDGTQVVDKDGNTKLVLDNDLSLSAVFKIKGYTKVDEFEDNNDYLIVSDDYAISSENAKNNDAFYRNAEIISRKTDIFGNNYISSDNKNLIWARRPNKYLYNSVINKYLNAGFNSKYYLTTSTTAQSWDYIDKDGVKKLYNGSSSRGYVGLDTTNKYFTNDSNGVSIELYKYSEDIKVNRYESTNTGGAE